MAADKDVPRDVVTLRELAQRWGKSEWTLSEWIRTGLFTVPVKRIRGIRHVRLRDADKWFDEQSEVATGVYKGRVKDTMMRKLDPDAFEDEEPGESRPKRERLEEADADRPQPTPEPQTREERAALHRALFSPEAVQARRDKPLREADEAIRQARVTAAAAHPDRGGSNDGSVVANAALAEVRADRAKLLVARKKEDAYQQEARRKREERSAKAKAAWAKRKQVRLDDAE